MCNINREVLLNKIASTLFNNEKFIIFLQQEQLKEGEDGKGEKTGKYTFLTQLIASESNPLRPKIEGQYYNFEWTGGFFKGMFVKIDVSNGDATVTIDSKDSKTNLLEDKHPNLLGLQDENKSELIQYLQEKIIKYLNNV